MALRGLAALHPVARPGALEPLEAEITGLDAKAAPEDLAAWRPRAAWVAPPATLLSEGQARAVGKRRWRRKLQKSQRPAHLLKKKTRG